MSDQKLPLSQETRSLALASPGVRRMFERGRELAARYGADAIADLSLGNPDLPVPPELTEALVAVAQEARHGYLPNAGLPELRRTLADRAARESRRPVTAEGVVVTVGAAGGLAIALRALLDPGDEVILFSPYFSEYPLYVRLAGGCPVVAEGDREHLPDPEALRAAITPRTRAVILDNPNNPSGSLADAERLARLAAVLDAAEQPIWLISDEPYADIVFDGLRTPPVLDAFTNVIVVRSWSKTLSIPGERIGAVLVPADVPAFPELMTNLIFANRALGFVHAPAIWQRVLARVPDLAVDPAPYERRRNRLTELVRAAGLDVVTPRGAFYLFPAVPGDDQVFAELAAAQRLLVVPGSSFGRPGHVRMAYCVADEVIERAGTCLARVMKELPHE
ncbi:MAG: pyridoxal phosphate-dependent aminotransferase [Bacillota bacterium]|nr:pyridoxal phosphate-dependent aminotransferase [Bacillota bacterium]